VQVRIARELVGRCRSLIRTILALDRELQARIEQTASTPTPNSPATPASHHSKPAPASTSATGSTAAATANSTAPCT
jgi:hypothetical protein